jgi:hypothetical protein
MSCAELNSPEYLHISQVATAAAIAAATVCLQVLFSFLFPATRMLSSQRPTALSPEQAAAAAALLNDCRCCFPFSSQPHCLR